MAPSLLSSSCFSSFPSIAAVPLLALLILVFLVSSSKRKPVFLLDYVCFRPPDAWRASSAGFMEHSVLNGMDDTTLSFQRKILQHSGLGEQTALPPSFRYLPCRTGMRPSREESQMVFFSIIDLLLRTTGVRPQDIGILVVNCCLFYPAPSLSAMLVNRYKMRADIKTYNLSGMGCAASLLAIDMVKELLQVHKNTYALVVSSENMSGRHYLGSRRSMLIANCLFRTGGAAVLLSNRNHDRKRAKYLLLHTMRTNTAADDRSFGCIVHGEDETGIVGVALSKDLMKVAGDALTKNITALAPYVLPVSEMLKYALNLVARKVLHAQVQPYVPVFKLGFQHYCIHAGGKAVIEELEKNLRLSPEDTEPSRMTLHRFGNTSSTSVWYELSYLEAMRSIKRGDKVWQVGLGSGFKCFSAVWRSLRRSECSMQNPWLDCLVQYPLVVPDVNDF